MVRSECSHYCILIEILAFKLKFAPQGRWVFEAERSNFRKRGWHVERELRPCVTERLLDLKFRPGVSISTTSACGTTNACGIALRNDLLLWRHGATPQRSKGARDLLQKNTKQGA